MKKVYLASSLHTDELKSKITKVVNYLREEGNHVYSPMELKIPNAFCFLLILLSFRLGLYFSIPFFKRK